MKSYIINILNFYLYSSIHISLCAIAFTYYSFLYAHYEIDWYYLTFIGSSTCLLYSLHRIIGIDKVGEFKSTGRFVVINNHKNHFSIYAMVSSIVALYAYLNLEFFIQWMVIIPAIVSLLYVLPIFPGNRRLRDYPFIKLFLIGFCWMWFIGTVPCWDFEGILSLSSSRFLFVIGITIPFDIRDKEVDQSSGVKTLAHVMSKKKALLLSALFVIASLIVIILNLQYSSEFLLTEVIVHLIALIVIVFSYQAKTDYYFSFLLDASMALFLIVHLMNL